MSSWPSAKAKRVFQARLRIGWNVKRGPGGSHLREKDLQRRLLYGIYGDVFGRAGDCFLNAHPNGVVFFEQQLFALQRLLVLHASEEDAPALVGLCSPSPMVWMLPMSMVCLSKP